MQGRSGARSSRPSSRPAAAIAPTRPTGSTASGRASRPPRPATRRGAATTGVSTRQRCRSIGGKLTEVPGRLQRPQHHPPLPRQPPEGDRDRRAASTGRPARRWPSARCSPRATRCACPARTSSAAPSRSAIRCSSTRRPRSATSRSTTSPTDRRASRSSTRCCRKRPCSASSTAIRWPSRTR